MTDELLDLVDKNDRVLGTVLKSVAHGDPNLIHREVAIAVFNDKGEVLLQQRSMNKTSPGSWKITAAGHVKSGEDPRKAIIREVYEELGIKIDPIFYKKVFEIDVYNGKPFESKFYWIYYSKVDSNINIKLNPSEVMDALWVKISNLGLFSKTHDYDIDSISHKIITQIYKGNYLQ